MDGRWVFIAEHSGHKGCVEIRQKNEALRYLHAFNASLDQPSLARTSTSVAHLDRIMCMVHNALKYLAHSFMLTSNFDHDVKV